jgi:hypothetical protein
MATIKIAWEISDYGQGLGGTHHAVINTDDYSFESDRGYDELNAEEKKEAIREWAEDDFVDKVSFNILSVKE